MLPEDDLRIEIYRGILNVLKQSHYRPGVAQRVPGS
jgi:hypothetical protein